MNKPIPTIAIVIILFTFLSCKDKLEPNREIDDLCREHTVSIFKVNYNLTKIGHRRVKIKVDSILSEMGDLECDSVIFMAHKCMSYYFDLEQEKDSALYYIFKAEQIALDLKDNSLLKEIYADKAAQLHRMNRNKEAADYFEKAIALDCHNLEEFKCNGMNSRVHIKYSTMLTSLGEIDRAIEELVIGDSLSSNQISVDQSISHDSTTLMVVNATLGNLYNMIDEPKQALESYQKALRFTNSSQKGPIITLSTCINSTNVLLKNYDIAKTGIERVLMMDPQEPQLLYPYQALAEIEMHNKNFRKAVIHAQNALDLSNKYGMHIKESKSILAMTKNRLGDYFASSKLWDEVLSEADKLTLNNKIDASIENLKSKLKIEKFETGTNLLDSIQVWQDSLLKEKSSALLAKTENKLNERILKDSVYIYRLESFNHKLKVKNQRKGLGLLSILGLALLLGIYKVWQDFKIKEEENTILQLSNTELKTFNENLQLKVDQIDSSFESKQPIPFQSINKTIYIKPSEIQYIKAEYNGVRIFLEDLNYWSNQSLKETLDKLKEYSFLQIHRSTIINIRNIEMVNSTYLKMKDGSEHNIGRAYKKQFKNSLKEEE